jgi:pterin-4a-carbinolamine dehydratase
MLRNSDARAISGEWEITQEKLSQKTSTGGPTRIYADVGLPNFNFQTSFVVDEMEAGKNGEAKIILSDADENENIRIDFIGGSWNMCRLTYGVFSSIKLFTVATGSHHTVNVTLRDNRVSVKIDDEKLLANVWIGQASDGKVGLGTFQASVTFSKPIVTTLIIKKCFVIMQFDDSRDFLYQLVIAPVLENHPEINFEYEKANTLLTSGKITEEIDERLKNADLVIADITENNPNVFYELGLAHAAKRTAILLKQNVPGTRLNDVPFDIRDFRIHMYDFSPAGFEDLKEKLPQIITTVLRNK